MRLVSEGMTWRASRPYVLAACALAVLCGVLLGVVDKQWLAAGIGLAGAAGLGLLLLGLRQRTGAPTRSEASGLRPGWAALVLLSAVSVVAVGLGFGIRMGVAVTVGVVSLTAVCLAIAITGLAGLNNQEGSTVSALAVGLLIRAFFVVANYEWSTTIGSVAHPYLQGVIDSATWHKTAQMLIRFDSTWLALRHTNTIGYSLVLSVLYRVFSPDILVGLLANLLFGLLNVAMIGVLTNQLLASQRAGRLGVWLAAVCPVLFTFDALIAKDTLIVTGVLLSCLGVIRLSPDDREGGSPWIGIALMAGGFLILSSNRPIMLLLPLALALTQVFTRKSSARRKFALIVLVSCLLLMAVPVANRFTREGMDVIGKYLVATTRVRGWVVSRNSLMDSMLGGYVNWPIRYRLITLPLGLLFQYLNPFRFWNLSFDPPYGFGWRVGNLIWYLWVGPICISGYASLREVGDSAFRKFSMIGLIGYGALAFMTVGSDTRYTMALMPFLLPVGAWEWERMRADPEASIRFKRRFWGYITAASLAVITYVAWKVVLT